MKRQWLAAVVAVIAGMAMEACSAGTGAVRVPEYLELKSRSLTLRQDLTRGGAIGYIAKAGEVRNFVNIADEGRYIQQSYYGGRSVDRRSEGQAETWSPWAWNPIQVGDYARNRAQITTFRKRRHSTYVACIPMQWDMDGHPAEVFDRVEELTAMGLAVPQVTELANALRAEGLPLPGGILHTDELAEALDRIRRQETQA